MEIKDKFKINKMEDYLSYKELVEINKKFNKKFNLNGESKKSNILEYKKDYGRLHPTQKPVDLLIDLIKTYTDEGDLVLDFTMGSGSTGEACLKTNRYFIGIELNDEYYEIAYNRINGYIYE
ncbi:TPA: DNA methyltransferase [Clostridium perfringens]